MSRLCRAAAIAAAIVLLPAVTAQPASAQLFDFGLSNVSWDWGGGNTVNDSGREVVRFDPQFQPGTIVVSFGDRRLYFITQAGEAISYPVAIPRDEDRWEGTTTVSNKRVNPSWTPTPTMIAENPRLPRWVPGGHPMNPLGVRALYLGNSFYRIHGTDAPWTIGTAVSKGCIRMYNKDVLDLYPRVNIGTTVVVTWQKFRSSPPSAEFVSAPRAHGPKLRPMDRSDLPPLR
jgi:lipoprotein-anchoring transpeptidase ErfK/SrfK